VCICFINVSLDQGYFLIFDALINDRVYDFWLYIPNHKYG